MNEFMIVAGEASGDFHGGALSRQMKQISPDCKIYGTGGSCMEQAGVELLFRVSDLGVTGFTEVAGKIFKIIKIFSEILRIAQQRRPTAVILIDYPDFNLRLAARLHRIGIPVIYFVSPQLWAWRSYRVKQIARDVKKMMVLFPFESDWYQSHGVQSVYVGNPIIDRMNELPSREICRTGLPAKKDTVLLGMFPGSRHNEVRRILPVMLNAFKLMTDSMPHLEALISLAPTISQEFIRSLIGGALPGSAKLFQGPAPELMKGADFAWVTSGTATLETAVSGTPMIVLYKTSWISYLLARMLVKVPYIAMANLVAQDLVAPELIQGDANPKKLAEMTQKCLSEPERLSEFRKKVGIVKEILDKPGASRRAAEEVFRTCALLPEDVHL